MTQSVTIKFWGTRGSIARPGAQTLRYGGNTSCVEVISARGTRVIIDCGTGAFDLGRALREEQDGPVRGRLLISHTHWDHIQGFPFFAPLFQRGGHWDIHGPTGLGRSLRDALSGQMEHTYFPVSLEDMGAHIRFHDLFEGGFNLEDIRITTWYLNHTALTLGYRLEMDGLVVVYACDHEPYSWKSGGEGPVHPLDRRHSEFLANADLVIHDAQFTDEEYARRIGWGHSPVEYVCAMARLAGVRRLALSHHDPSRTDDGLDALVARLRGTLGAECSPLEVFAAADGQVVELPIPAGVNLAAVPEPHAVSAVAGEAGAADPLVLIGVTEEGVAQVLQEAAAAAGVRAVRAADACTLLDLARRFQPPLVLLEDRPELGIQGLEVCRAIRSLPNQAGAPPAVVMVSDREGTGAGDAAGVSGWLVMPFSGPYAKAHLQSWLLRTACRWARAPMMADEEVRLEALRELRVLDTPSEERFDRLTRLAAAVAEVPVALVSLVDRDRQWFKSCQGLSSRETPRDVSFCAHALALRATLVVPDTLLDERFADNPLVTGGLRVRFYAGVPLFLPNGSCVGTLCVIDTRPRQLAPAVLKRLEDLARLVEEELTAGLAAASA